MGKRIDALNQRASELLARHEQGYAIPGDRPMPTQQDFAVAELQDRLEALTKRVAALEALHP